MARDLETRDAAHSSSKRSALRTAALFQWREVQPTDVGPQDWHHSYFERVRFMMPQRDRLANTLFQCEKLRSPAGMLALQDMQDLFSQSAEVEVRPGLEADKCHCPDTHGPLWEHIHQCHGKHLSAEHGSTAYFCFHCSSWVQGDARWSEHCESHIEHASTLQLIDPLEHGGFLAAAGYCPCCLNDSSLDPTRRLQQFLRKTRWHTHVRDHIDANRQSDAIIKCPFSDKICNLSLPQVLNSICILKIAMKSACYVRGSLA